MLWFIRSWVELRGGRGRGRRPGRMEWRKGKTMADNYINFSLLLLYGYFVWNLNENHLMGFGVQRFWSPYILLFVFSAGAGHSSRGFYSRLWFEFLLKFKSFFFVVKVFKQFCGFQKLVFNNKVFPAQTNSFPKTIDLRHPPLPHRHNRCQKSDIPFSFCMMAIVNEE